MSIEQYVDFKSLSFGPGNLRDLRYSVRGTDKEHCAKTDQMGVRWSHLDTITPDGNGTYIWADVLNSEPLGLPKACNTCPEDRQVRLWRTFTSNSLEGFKQAQGRGVELNLPSIKHLEHYGDVYVCNSADVDRPGVFWVARDPDLALSVGLSRALLEGKPVTLLGITLCEEDMQEGTRFFMTRASGESTVLWELGPERLATRTLSAGGEIVTSISKKRIEDGVVYNLDHTFFKLISDAFGDAEPTEHNLRELSSIISDILLDFTYVDPGVDDKNYVSDLPRVWKPFLTRMPVETFMWS